MCESKIQVNSFFNDCHFVAFLYVDLGADVEGEKKGLAHVTEHMLVSFDRGEESDYYVMAHTTNRYMVYEILFDGESIGKEKIMSMLYRIMDGTSLSHQTLEKCKKEVLTEIEQEKDRFLWMKKWYGEEYEKYIPLGTEEVVRNLTKEDIEQFMQEYYLKADKQVILVGEDEKLPYKNISNPDWKGYSCEKAPIYQYICEDLLYLQTQKCQKTNLDFACQLHKIQGEYVVERRGTYTEKWIRKQLCRKEAFKENFTQISSIYQQCTEFDRDNLKQIAIDCISQNRIPFQMKQVKEVLKEDRERWYFRFREYLENLKII